VTAPSDSEECIHGLAHGECDICFPKKRPEPVPAARAVAPRTRTATAVRTRSAGKPIDVSARRIYHITHLDNLAFIADAGALVAGAEPAVDLSAAGVRDARSRIPAPDGMSVGEHVPFFADLDSSLWAAIVEGTPDPRVDTSASASDFAILVTSIGAVTDAVATDGDAAHPLTRFALSDQAGRLLVSLASDSSGRSRDAEVLVPDRVPVSALTVVTVANDRAQRVARDAGLGVRVAIHPPWFQPQVRTP
jgi:hypothetical protein